MRLGTPKSHRHFDIELRMKARLFVEIVLSIRQSNDEWLLDEVLHLSHFHPTTIAQEITIYSTVTLFARFLGWSTSQPRRTAMW
jgi:hypothetical protein